MMSIVDPINVCVKVTCVVDLICSGCDPICYNILHHLASRMHQTHHPYMIYIYIYAFQYTILLNVYIFIHIFIHIHMHIHIHMCILFFAIQFYMPWSTSKTCTECFSLRQVHRVGDPRRVIVGGQSQGCCVTLAESNGPAWST